jgi:hypothetical protein
LVLSGGLALIWLGPYFPALDLPWHGAVAAVAAEGDPQRFLGFFEVEWELSSYLLLYIFVLSLGKLVGISAAVNVALSLYLVGFFAASRSLLRAFGRDPAAALLAVPAAFSMTLEYGFLSYAMAFPLTFWCWSATRRACSDFSSTRLGLVFLFVLGAALCHPFAALLAAVGAAVIALVDSRATLRIRLSILAALGAGWVPAAVATRSVAKHAPPLIPGLDEADFLSKLTTQDFVPVLEALATAPVRLFGFMADGFRFAAVAAALALCLVQRWRHPPEESARPALFTLAVIMLAFVLTPWTFEWPRHWFAVQLRLLPLLWLLGLVLLGWSKQAAPWAERMAALVACLSLAAAAQKVSDFAGDARDLREVIEASAPGKRTLSLIETEPARERRPAPAMRHAGAWLFVERGGYVSHLPFAGSQLDAGHLVPARLARDAPDRPAAPVQGRPRSFSWSRHAAGWEQFLIRDLDPEQPFDYFRGHADEVELVAKVGHFRLYRRAFH